MKKSMILCLFLIILLTSCVQVKKIDYTTYSTSFIETNQDNNSKLFDDIYFSSVNIYSPKDLCKYINNLNNLSKSSYESIKNADYLSCENIEREIIFQNNILKLLKKLEISKEYFESDSDFNNAKIYKDTNIIDIINARINYLEILLGDIECSSISTKTALYQLDNVTLPLLIAEAEKTYASFSQSF